jgi:hypothetical protein
MIYQISVDNQGSLYTLDFELDKGPVVDLWLACVRELLQGQWTISPTQWTRSWPTQATIEEETVRVYALAERLGLPPGLDLNALHLEFHRAHDSANTDPGWDQLNLMIHGLEEQQRTLTRARWWRSGFGFFLADPVDSYVPSRPIPPELRPFWAHTAQSGELLLGYHTVGKSLADCYRDNDVDCVAQGMTRQQQTVSTETVCLWAPDQGNISQAVTHKEIVAWLEQNGIKDKVDLDLHEYQYHRLPKLGRYVGQYNLLEINNILKQGTIVDVRLFE